MTVDRETFERALTELRFDDAAAMADGDGELRDEVDRRRAEALAEARALHDRMIALGHDGVYETLVELADDPRTAALLGLLPETPRFRAELQVSQAERWAESRRQTAARRLAEARNALEDLDVELARGLLARIDDRFLDRDLVEERDALLLDVSARTMEVEELSEAADRLLDEIAPPPSRRRRWWRRDD